ncbi:helix-turn-helix domain-containing protein [Nocardia sp. CA-107356]|uniref:helix-turn-helix domain-containing protein n=1 Tax=Nocardia sp. CA-107356 TaxID=3239972 RepID=UPI003D930DD1
MSNERLRSATAAAGLTKNSLAELVGVSTKTVERWLTQDRCPHPRIRVEVARALGQDETYLWPELLAGSRTMNTSLSEIVQIWPTRPDVPHDVWRALLRQASKNIEILVYAGGFLVESLDFVNVAQAKSEAGAEIRILLGDADSEAVRARS